MIVDKAAQDAARSYFQPAYQNRLRDCKASTVVDQSEFFVRIDGARCMPERGLKRLREILNEHVRSITSGDSECSCEIHDSLYPVMAAKLRVPSYMTQDLFSALHNKTIIVEAVPLKTTVEKVTNCPRYEHCVEKHHHTSAHLDSKPANERMSELHLKRLYAQFCRHNGLAFKRGCAPVFDNVQRMVKELHLAASTYNNRMRTLRLSRRYQVECYEESKESLRCDYKGDETKILDEWSPTGRRRCLDSAPPASRTDDEHKWPGHSRMCVANAPSSLSADVDGPDLISAYGAVCALRFLGLETTVSDFARCVASHISSSVRRAYLAGVLETLKSPSALCTLRRDLRCWSEHDSLSCHRSTVCQARWKSLTRRALVSSLGFFSFTEYARAYSSLRSSRKHMAVPGMGSIPDRFGDDEIEGHLPSQWESSQGGARVSGMCTSIHDEHLPKRSASALMRAIAASAISQTPQPSLAEDNTSDFPATPGCIVKDGQEQQFLESLQSAFIAAAVDWTDSPHVLRATIPRLVQTTLDVPESGAFAWRLLRQSQHGRLVPESARGESPDENSTSWLDFRQNIWPSIWSQYRKDLLVPCTSLGTTATVHKSRGGGTEGKPKDTSRKSGHRLGREVM